VTVASERLRVLLLDDDARFRVLLEDLLGDDRRIEVVASVGDVDAAVGAAVAMRPDVAVVDVRLPEGDGPLATRRLRAACPWLRVFGLSTFSDAANVDAMRAAGAERYLVKGRSEDDVLEALLDGLGRSAADGRGTCSRQATDCGTA
jgi:DNA-binding NarL/FixJ family response regulator